MSQSEKACDLLTTGTCESVVTWPRSHRGFSLLTFHWPELATWCHLTAGGQEGKENEGMVSISDIPSYRDPQFTHTFKGPLLRKLPGIRMWPSSEPLFSPSHYLWSSYYVDSGYPWSIPFSGPSHFLPCRIAIFHGLFLLLEYRLLEGRDWGWFIPLYRVGYI